MATKALNFKMDEMDITELKHIASVYHMTVTDIIKEGIREYIERLKADPFYKLTSNIEDADEYETEEILETISNLSDDDLTISSSKKFTVWWRRAGGKNYDLWNPVYKSSR